jgi:hypothetical protein
MLPTEEGFAIMYAAIATDPSGWMCANTVPSVLTIAA